MFVTPVNGRNPARGLTIQCGRNRFLSNGAPRLSPLYFSVFLGADRGLAPFHGAHKKWPLLFRVVFIERHVAPVNT